MPAATQPMAFLYSDDIKARFRARGWVWSSGSLYYNGNGTASHPHLHISIDGQRTVRRGSPDRPEGDIRAAVTMIAYSDGGQGRGGGGTTYMRLGTPVMGPRPEGAGPPPAPLVLAGYTGPSTLRLDQTPDIVRSRDAPPATNYAARATRIADPRIRSELEWVMAYFLPDE
ncbi:hypothetical protein SAMN03159338_3646 [Sphingomonas sp. NFR04]|nr:hypothetical protein SAMN03159338_3646 [Sphingomonas sp. NFR04]